MTTAKFIYLLCPKTIREKEEFIKNNTYRYHNYPETKSYYELMLNKSSLIHSTFFKDRNEYNEWITETFEKDFRRFSNGLCFLSSVIN